MNPYSNMNLHQAQNALNDLLAKRREAKKNKDKSLLSKIGQEQTYVHQRIRSLMRNYKPSEEQVAKLNRKLEDRKDRISRFGFAISSHALHRYKLRFESDTTMEALYEKMLATDLKEYLKIKSTGQCAIGNNMVAVIKNKLILTFKDVKE